MSQQQPLPKANRSSNLQALSVEARRQSVRATPSHSQRMVQAVLEAFAQLEAERLASVAPHGDDDEEPNSAVRKIVR